RRRAAVPGGARARLDRRARAGGRDRAALSRDHPRRGGGQEGVLVGDRARRLRGPEPPGVRPLALLLLASAASAAPPPSVDPLLAELEAASKQVSTLSGQFTQKNRLKLFRKELTSKGRLYFQAPRR